MIAREKNGIILVSVITGILLVSFIPEGVKGQQEGFNRVEVEPFEPYDEEIMKPAIEFGRDIVQRKARDIYPAEKNESSNNIDESMPVLAWMKTTRVDTGMTYFLVFDFLDKGFVVGLFKHDWYRYPFMLVVFQKLSDP